MGCGLGVSGAGERTSSAGVAHHGAAQSKIDGGPSGGTYAHVGHEATNHQVGVTETGNLLPQSGMSESVGKGLVHYHFAVTGSNLFDDTAAGFWVEESATGPEVGHVNDGSFKFACRRQEFFNLVQRGSDWRENDLTVQILALGVNDDEGALVQWWGIVGGTRHLAKRLW